MKIKRLTVIALGLVVLMSIAACTPQDTGFNNQNRLQTRVNQNRLNENTNWNNNDRMIDNLDDGTNTNLNTGMVRGNTGTMRNNNNMTTSLGNLNNSSREIARKIAALPEVEDATVVLHNDTALVGVNLNGNNNNNNNNNNISAALRNKIENMVKDNNNNTKNIKNVSITADPDMIDRITNISSGMTNQVGNDVRDFTNDIEELIRDIVPGGNGINNTNINR